MLRLSASACAPLRYTREGQAMIGPQSVNSSVASTFATIRLPPRRLGSQVARYDIVSGCYSRSFGIDDPVRRT